MKTKTNKKIATQLEELTKKQEVQRRFDKVIEEHNARIKARIKATQEKMETLTWGAKEAQRRKEEEEAWEKVKKEPVIITPQLQTLKAIYDKMAAKKAEAEEKEARIQAIRDRQIEQLTAQIKASYEKREAEKAEKAAKEAAEREKMMAQLKAIYDAKEAREKARKTKNTLQPLQLELKAQEQALRGQKWLIVARKLYKVGR